MSVEEKYARLSHALRMASGNLLADDNTFDPVEALRYVLDQAHLRREEKTALRILKIYVRICDELRETLYPSAYYTEQVSKALEWSRALFAATRKLL